MPSARGPRPASARQPAFAVGACYEIRISRRPLLLVHLQVAEVAADGQCVKLVTAPWAADDCVDAATVPLLGWQDTLVLARRQPRQLTAAEVDRIVEQRAGTPRPSGRPLLSLEQVHRPLHRHGEVFYGLTNVDRFLELYAVDLDPDYQRGHVWTAAQQGDFIGHVLEGGDTSAAIVNTGPDGGREPTEMVDGKQRTQAALVWARGQVPAHLSDGRSVWVDQLGSTDQRRCSIAIGLRFALVRLTRTEVLDLYIRLNRGGTVHTAQEIDHVRYLLEAERAGSTPARVV